jgi:hypothetical protein
MTFKRKRLKCDIEFRDKFIDLEIIDLEIQLDNFGHIKNALK